MVTLAGTVEIATTGDEVLEQSATAGALRAALTDVLPIFAGVAPFGLALGVAISNAQINAVAGWAGSFLMFSGSGHMAVVSVMGAGGGLLAVLLASLLVNARFAIYSALLAPAFRSQPTWFRWVAPYFILDQTYLLVARRIEAGESPRWVRRYYLGIGLAVLTLWPPLIALGVFAGPVISASWNLAFAAPLLLAGMVAPSLMNRTAVIVAISAAAAAVSLVSLPSGLGLIAATGIGTLAGVIAERSLR